MLTARLRFHCILRRRFRAPVRPLRTAEIGLRIKILTIGNPHAIDLPFMRGYAILRQSVAEVQIEHCPIRKAHTVASQFGFGYVVFP